jgi:hypothetical protein
MVLRRRSAGLPRAARRSAFLLLWTVGFAGVVTAQESASIIGQVTDESGAVLPGVTVTATSPSLQVPSISVVTDTRGDYRISPLPIGTYTVEYSLPGFQSVRHEGVRLIVDFTAKMDVPMKVGSLAETITVSGAAPVVDTTSTAATTQFTRETIELLPTSRNGIVSLLAQAPGVRTLRDVGGSTLNQVPTYRAFGQAGEAYSTLEGVQTSSLQASSGQANYWDYTTLEEASVRTIGNSAEVPSRGVNLTALVKSGGNDFHSSTTYNKTGPAFQSANIDDSLRALGVGTGTTISDRSSISSDLGGRILRDKLWFYVAGRRQVDDEQPLNTFMPDGVTPAIAKGRAWFATGKISYQMSQANRFVGYYQFNHKYDTSSLNQFIPFEFRGGIMTPSRTGKIEWQRVFGSAFVTSFQYGYWTYDSHYYSFAPRDVAPSLDFVTLQNRGPMSTVGQRPHNPRHHYKGSATLYRPDLFAGSHEFKMGFDYTDNWFGRQYPDLPPDTELNGAPSSFLYNYRLRPSNGFASCNVAPGAATPCQIEVWNNPAYAKVVSHYLGTYLTDSWTVGRRLTLNLGIRFAHDNGFVPDSCRDAAAPPGDVAFPATCYDRQQFNVWNSFAPRMHASWDVAGDGRTLIKGGWGRFDHQRQQVPELDAADPQVRTMVNYRWRDFNGNGIYDPGEVNLNTNSADFLSQSGGTNTVPSPTERQPKSDELSLTMERELAESFGLRVSYIHSRYRNTYRLLNLFRPMEAYNIELVRPDPGEDGEVGSADDPGTSVTYYEFPTALNGRAFERFTRVNDRRADQKFNSIDMSLYKRMSHNWQLQTSYSATKRNVPFLYSTQTTAPTAGGEFNGNVESAPLTPNNEINTADRNWEYSAKLSGVYVFPLQILTAVNYEARSGYPWARQVRFTGGRTIPNIVLNVERIGSRRLPLSHQLDLRLEKSFNLAKGQKVAARINMFNALNANTILDVQRLSGPSFGLPTDIMPPRITEFSMTYSF